VDITQQHGYNAAFFRMIQKYVALSWRLFGAVPGFIRYKQEALIAEKFGSAGAVLFFYLRINYYRYRGCMLKGLAGDDGGHQSLYS
jgi:hypothetical protein